ncbi:MAG TPA: BMP family ABC transporter substrate-binding protein [Rhodopila sp.]|uniref:BMP family ABC transporter substrate-binding protein n=1 Tax=Rhodopila sp. TaxID=2480087 RepID=UPI002CF0EBB6|nr:BMP family ABC transporter substrate-binding protein [Rhodopila sp.]HVY14066.1 BMP family ABC transporter substrate-binding protein [Rhodopila sp.]
MADGKSASFSRRTLLQGAAVLSAAATLGVPEKAQAAKDLVVGFIYVGAKDDYGYNQAHAQAAALVKKMPGVKVVEEEKVPETDDVSKTMESMIELDGATLLFPTSFGYFDPYMLKTAAKYKNIQFRHCGGLWKKDKDPMNTGSYFGYIGMCQYLNGIAAAHATKSKKIGFVAAKPIPQVLININSFTLGARSVDPTITTSVIFTGEWSMPVKEAEATNSLIGQGIDVITCHVDGPKVIMETSERRGIYVCGYHADQSKLAPKGYLTGAEWNWITVYRQFVDEMKAGKPLPNFVRGGLAEGFVKMSPYGPALSAAGRKNVDTVKAEIMKGGFSVFKGPLKDNKGNVVVPAGKAYPETAIELESCNYLVEGVVGAIA